jgi:hypothetical protein
MLDMVSYSSQCFKAGGAGERAWSEGQAGSLEKSWCCDITTFRRREAQGADGSCVQVRDESRTYPFVPPKAEEYWASSGHNLRMSFDEGITLWKAAILTNGLKTKSI